MEPLYKHSFRQGTVSAVNKLSGTIVAILAAGALACASLAMAQAAAQSQVPVMHVEVDLQPIEVQVKDAEGNNIEGLTEKDFTLLENRQPQKISFFDAGSGPVSLAVLVDSSSSVISQGSFGSAQMIAARFMRTARPDDEIFAMDFTDQMGPFQPLTHEQLQNPSVAPIPAVSDGSGLYDAIATALCHLRSSKNLRQAIVVVTDGVDEHSRINLEQLIDLVRASHAQLFMIGLQSKPNFHFQGYREPRLTLITGHDVDNPRVVFNRLLNESGAESFIPNSESTLEQALSAVSDMLSSEYTLAYYPHGDSNQTFRKIDVKVRGHDLRVLTRRFIASSSQADAFVHFEPGTCTISPKFHPYPYEADLTNGPSGTVYRGDFSNPHSGWPTHSDSRYVRGTYELSNPKEQKSVFQPGMPGTAMVRNYRSQTTFHPNVIAAYGPWWHDFTASVDMKAFFSPATDKPNSPFPYGAHPAAGLVFRMNMRGYYALLLSGRDNAQDKNLSVELVRRTFTADGSYTESQILPWTKIAVQPSPSGNELSIIAVGDQIFDSRGWQGSENRA